MKGNQTERRHAELDRAAGTVHSQRNTHDLPAAAAHDGDRFLNAPALGEDILNDEQLFGGRNFESPTERQFAFRFLHKNEAKPQLAGYFLAKHQSTQGRREDGGGAEGAHFVGQFRDELFHDGHLLESQGALEILAAVQPAAEHEMAFQQRPAVTKKLQHFALGHGLRLRVRPKEQSAKWRVKNSAICWSAASVK